MEYLADTVAIIRHFANTGPMGLSARQAFNEVVAGNATLYVSVISFMEVLYLAERNRIPLSFGEVQSRIQGSSNYRVLDLTLDIVEAAHGVPGLELHDRMIVATARYYGLPLMTSDQEITASGLVSVIW